MFPFCSLRVVLRFAPHCPPNIANAARGPRGFIEQYSAARGRPAELSPAMVAWRDRVVACHLRAEQLAREDPNAWTSTLEYSSNLGPYPVRRWVRAPGSVLWSPEGEPLPRWWALVCWAYLPHPVPALRWLREHEARSVSNDDGNARTSGQVNGK